MRNFIVWMISFALIGAAIVFTFVFIQEDMIYAIPFVWIMMLAGAGEAVNVGIVKPKKKDKNDKKERH